MARIRPVAATPEQPEDTQQQPAGRFPQPRDYRAWVAATLFLIALAAGLTALIAVASGRGSPLAGSSTFRSPSATAGVTPGVIPAGQARSSAGKASASFPSAAQVAASGGAISLPARLRSSAIAWQSGAGGTSLAAVMSLFGTALQQKGLGQYAEMRYSCTQLARSVRLAQAGPPIPVAAMQALYVQALAELTSGAADCRAAITVTSAGESLRVHVDVALLDQAASELAAGSRDIFRSTAEIVIASRAPH